MQTEHRIDELIVDLSFNTTRLARHETALLSEWLSEDLLPALDKVFSHYSPGTQILRFETLEFDCGNLTSRHYQQAIREQLLKQFAQLLESQLLAVAPENRQLGISTAQGDTPNAELALKQLFSYLATGQLSAHHPAVQPQSSANKNKHAQSPGLHAQLLDAVIAQHNIADLLRELPQRDLLIQRLLTQFTLLQRMELLRQLAPQHVQNVIALFDLLQLLENNYRIHLSHAKDQSINYGSTIEPSTNEDSTFKGLTFEGSITERLITGHQPINYDSLGSDAVQQTVWETLLELALAQPQATAQFWINQILHKLASKFAFSINQLQQDLVAIKLPASAAAQALENLQAIIAQTMADRNVAEAKENSVKIRPDNLLQQASDNQYSFETIKPQSLNAESPIDAEQQSVAQLQQLVAAALIRADANQLQQLWPQLLANEQLLLAALQHYLPQAEIRQQLMLRLPITLLAGIITLLAPALNDIFYRLQQCASQLNDFIAAQLKSFTSSVASSENSNQNENAEAQQSAELVARQLWEITLGLLFNGTTVNSHYQGDPEVFLNALALRYAELHNLEEQPLQQLLRQLVFGQQQDEASNNRFISSQNAERLHNASAGIGPTVDLQQDQQEIQKNQELEKARELLINQEQQSNYPVSNATLGIADVALDTTGSTGETVRLNSDITRLTADTSRLNANNLVSVSDHQLFDLCLRLKSGALVWSSLAADVALLQRLISSYIRLGHSATAENCADFVAAIDAQAESSPAPAVFYLTVLQTLIADKLIDLELIAQTVQRNSKSQQIDVEIPSLVAQEAELKQGMNLLPDLRLPQKPMELEAFADTTIKSQQALVASSLNNLTQEVAQTKRVPAELNESSVHTAEIPEAGTSAIKPNIEAITQELLRDTQPLLRLQHLQLNTIQWQELTFELLKRSSVADVNASTDLIAAIEIQARGLLNPTLYYRRIIQALLQQQPIDLEVFADTNIDSQRNDVADSGINNLTQEVAYDKQVPAELNESSSQTVEIPAAATSAVKPDIEAITQELLRDTQPLLRLQHLQLNTIQWQELTFELLKRSSVADVNASTDLIAAIEIQARGLLNPTLYYRRIIQALLQQQPIDLEVFADTNIDSQRNDVADSGINNLTQEVAYDKQVPAELNESSSQTVEIPAAATSAVKPDIEAITQELLRDTQPSLRLQQLQLNTTRWQELTFELLKHSSVLNVITNADLIAAIEKQGRGLLNPALYYRRIIRAILQRKPIDLEAFAVESIENPANASTQTSGRDLPLPVHTVEQMPRNSSVQSQDQNDIASTYTIAATDPIASIVKILTTDTRPLLHLQQLQLDATQWQELACELIKHNAVINFTDVVDVTDVGSNTELIAAIKSQARSALNPIIYYRRIIQAVLQQQSIDLEAFSATNADQQYTSTNSSVNNLTQDVTIATHADHPEYFTSESPGSKNLYPEQAIDYSLSTGTDTSVRKPALSLAQLFAANQPLTQEQLLTLQQHVNLLLNHPNPTLVAEWSQLLAPANNAQLLIQLVPSHLLHQIMLRLQPARYAALDAVVKVVLEALALLVNDLNNPAIKQVRWEFIIRYLLTTNDNQIATASNESAQTLSIELCKHLAPAAGIDDLQRLVNLTQRRIVLLKPAAQLKPAMRLQEINTNSATQSDENTPQWESGLHIDNAGAVLAGAFLPRLFSMLNLIQDGKFIHPGAADRAVHLVQFMVTGASSTPEYDLILNKILCGISTSIPVSAGIEITEQEQTLIEQMLTSMIQHWKVLGSTSISGLRETFFQRQGWLILEEDCWRLKVKEQTFDLLLDRLPWSISLIKHGWMDKPLRVSWRNHS